jgi:hypothetical protein
MSLKDSPPKMGVENIKGMKDLHGKSIYVCEYLGCHF